MIWPDHLPLDVLLSSPCSRAAFRSNSVVCTLIQSLRLPGFRPGEIENFVSSHDELFFLYCADFLSILFHRKKKKEKAWEESPNMVKRQEGQGQT